MGSSVRVEGGVERVIDGRVVVAVAGFPFRRKLVVRIDACECGSRGGRWGELIVVVGGGCGRDSVVGECVEAGLVTEASGRRSRADSNLCR